MADPTPLNVIFAKFIGGEIGRSRPLKTALDMFRGLNVWTYPNGAIGPRPPWQDCAYTGLPQLSVQTFDVNRFTLVPGEDPAKIILTVDAVAGVTAVFAGDSTPGSAVADRGNVTGLILASASWGNTLYFCSATTNNGGKIDLNTYTVGDVAAMPLGFDLAVLGTRMVIANPGATPVSGQLRFSADADPDTWDVGNFYNVGSPAVITALHELRNALVICKYDGTIWQTTGALTESQQSATTRKVDLTFPAPYQHNSHGSVAGSSNLWYCAGKQMVQFTGAQANTVERPDIPITEANKALYAWDPSDNHVGNVLPLPDDDEFIVVGTLDKLSDSNIHTGWAQVYRARDQWTRHTIPTTFRHTNAGPQPSVDEARAIKTPKIAPAGVAYICTSADPTGSGAVPIKVFRLNTQQEYPHVPVGLILSGGPNGPTSSTLVDADSGAPVVGQFSTAEVWAEDQEYVRPKETLVGDATWTQGFTQIRVRSVEIDLSYNPTFTPASTYNHFTFSVTSVQRDATANEAVATSTAQVFAPTAAAPSPDSDGLVHIRHKFQCGDQGWGSGFRINLNDWSGIMVHRIVALVDLDGPRY